MDKILTNLIEQMFEAAFESDALPALMFQQLVKDKLLTEKDFLKTWEDKTRGFIRRHTEEV